MGKRKRPSFLPEGAEALLASVIEAITEAAKVVMEALTELWQAIVELTNIAVRSFVTSFAPVLETLRRSQMYKYLKKVVGKRAAWYLAEHWPRRWLPRWSVE